MTGSQPPAWQQAWDQAQSQLSSIRESLSTLPRYAPRILRVGQLDAELLDQELLQILKDPISKALGMIQGTFTSQLEPELTLLIQLMLYKFSIWDTGATYGAKLQDLRFDALKHRPGQSLAPSGIPRQTLLTHALLTVLMPYLHTRLRAHALSQGWADAPSSDPRRKVWEAMTTLEASHSALGLLGFIVFLWDGQYRTITDRILNLRLVPVRQTVTRNVSYEFMNRQMVWHAFTEFLLFLLPLINMRVIKRRTTQYLAQIPWTSILPPSTHSLLGIQPSPDSTSEKSTRKGKYWALSPDQCTICAEDASSILPTDPVPTPHPSSPSSSTTHPPTIVTTAASTDEDAIPSFPIYTPYLSSCQHTYCYVCLSERMIRAAEDGEEGWRCLRCDEIVRSATRIEGEYVPSASSDMGDSISLSDSASALLDQLDTDEFEMDSSDHSYPSGSEE